MLQTFYVLSLFGQKKKIPHPFLDEGFPMTELKDYLGFYFCRLKGIGDSFACDFIVKVNGFLPFACVSIT